MLMVEHLSSTCPCKALSWALTGDGTRLPDLRLPTLSSRGRDLPNLRSWQPLLSGMCFAGARGKAARSGRAVSEDRGRQAESQNASGAVPSQAGGRGKGVL